jgi:hypothetical protein
MYGLGCFGAQGGHAVLHDRIIENTKNEIAKAAEYDVVVKNAAKCGFDVFISADGTYEINGNKEDTAKLVAYTKLVCGIE